MARFLLVSSSVDQYQCGRRTIQVDHQGLLEFRPHKGIAAAWFDGQAEDIGRPRRRCSRRSYCYPLLPRGCCWVQQCMPPPYLLMARGSTCTTFRPGSTRSMVAFMRSSLAFMASGRPGLQYAGMVRGRCCWNRRTADRLRAASQRVGGRSRSWASKQYVPWIPCATGRASWIISRSRSRGGS